MNYKNFDEYIFQILSADEKDAFFESLKMPLNKSISIVDSKISVDKCLEILKKDGYEFEKNKFDDNLNYVLIKNTDDIAIGKHRLHELGYFYIQEIAASLPVFQMDLKGDELILDMSAAPGGKTIQICNRIFNKNNGGIIVANEPQFDRLLALSANLNRVGFSNSVITNFDAKFFGKNMNNMFDIILLDAPCSGEGTVFKSNFAVENRSLGRIKDISFIQTNLLDSAFHACKVGGQIIYSTCTLNHFENELQIQNLLNKYGSNIEIEEINLDNICNGLNIEGIDKIISQNVARLRPHKSGTGGFFISKIKKISDPNPVKNKNTVLNNFEFSNKLNREVSVYLKTQFGIDNLHEDSVFVGLKGYIHVVSKKISSFIDKIKIDKPGIPILKIIGKDGFVPLHGISNIFGDKITKNIIQIEYEDMKKYINGQDLEIDIDKTPNDHFLLKYQDFPVGITKKVGNNLKNKFMKSYQQYSDH